MKSQKFNYWLIVMSALLLLALRLLSGMGVAGAASDTNHSIALPDSSKPELQTSITETQSILMLQNGSMVEPSNDIFWDGELNSGTVAMIDDQVIAIPNEDEQVNFIIVMEAEPLAVQLRQLERHISSQERQEFATTYKTQLEGTQSELITTLQEKHLIEEVGQQFNYLVNGITVKAQMSEKAAIEKLPEVKAVYFDYKAQITLEESVPLIGAPTIWNMTDGNGLPVKGSGIRVAIIDTGIDYTHTAFGSCSSVGAPGCRVVDGYDFVNNDADPMDDNLHGSHVAGIVAGNDNTIQGVAPEADLLAYKVCDAYGSCSYSHIIAALERSVDPNGDTNPNDHVEVLNMSLGGSGNPNDVLAQATNQAVASGVTVVVSAGNSGPSYFTVGSPGAAANAITVGASTKTDGMAYFSSKGWVGDYQLKPDVVAPGYDINSAVLNNGYARLNGTSMASPHVAGAAALLHQLNPTWDPEMVKASLMNTALDINYDPFVQGAGRIDLVQAATTSVLASPGSLSFGLIDPNISNWISTKNVTLRNPTSSTQTYQLSVASGLHAAITAQLSQTSVTLAPGQSTNVQVTLTVDNANLPYGSEEPFSYDGDILITNGTEEEQIPFALIKASLLEITFDELPWFVIIHDPTPGGDNWVKVISENNLQHALPPGTYDLIVAYHDATTFLVRENIEVEDSLSLTINRSEVDNQLSMEIIDLDDQQSTAVANGIKVQNFQHSLSRHGVSMLTFGGTMLPFDASFSDMSSAYHYEAAGRIKPEATQEVYYDTSYELSGINSSQTLVKDVDDFKPMTYHYEMPTGTSELQISYMYLNFWGGGWGGGTSYLTPLTQTIYHSPRTEQTTYFHRRLQVYRDNYNHLIAESPYLGTENGTELSVYGRNCKYPFSYCNLEEMYTTSEQDFVINHSPQYWATHFYNDSTTLYLSPNSISGYLRDQSQNELNSMGLTYTLDSNSGPISTGTLSSSSISVPPGPLTFTVPYTGLLQSDVTQGLVVAEFNTTLNDKNPPAISELQVLNNGVRSDYINGAGQIKVELDDNQGLGSVSIFVNPNGAGWQALPTTQSGDIYLATIPSFGTTSEIPVGLKIVAEDTSGNRLTNTLEPAFIASATSTAVILALDPPTITTGVGETFELPILVQAGTQEVDGAAAHLNFDPALLEVVSITPGSEFSPVILNQFDNQSGQLDFAAGNLTGPFPSGTFTLATVTFRSIALTDEDGTRIEFNSSFPRRSDVTFDGTSVLSATVDSTVTILNGVLTGSVTLQGRPTPPNSRWVVPLRISLTIPGEAQASYQFEVMTDENGSFTITSGIMPGTYEVRIKNSHTLQNKQTVTLTNGNNSFDFGTLREGDANDDNYVTLIDFSILVSTFAKCEGNASYNAQADFNGDTCVTILDFSLLASNFATAGQHKPQIEAPTTQVAMSISPVQTTIKPGDTFNVTVRLHTGSQQVDGAQMGLHFDPEILAVEEVRMGDQLALELLNQFDNSTGTINFAAGSLEDFPSGEIELMTVQYRALKAGQTALAFDPATDMMGTNVTFGGVSVLSTLADGVVTVNQPTAVRVHSLAAPATAGWQWIIAPLSMLLLAGGLLMARRR